jgi:hypothetical protein
MACRLNLIPGRDVILMLKRNSGGAAVYPDEFPFFVTIIKVSNKKYKLWKSGKT